MKVLIAHNEYTRRGGEDESTEVDAQLLADNGVEVVRFTVSSNTIKSQNPIRTGAQAIWNQATYRKTLQVIAEHRPDVVHVQNFFPVLSPSILYAADRAGVAVVQSLRNYRLACVNGLFFRDGKPCEDCLGRIPWPGVMHRCYHESVLQSTAVATMLTAHRVLHTWHRRVDTFVALSAFTSEKLAQAGVPSDRMVIRPNCVHPVPPLGDGADGHALFVGRLSPEKGVATLIKAWRRIEIPLLIVGDGPLMPELLHLAAGNPSIRFLGQLPREDVYALVAKAALLVCPSECYETFGRVVIEAFAGGTPVVSSRIGALAELIDEGINGAYFNPGDVEQLTTAVTRLLSNPNALRQMRHAARQTYLNKYSPQVGYRTLREIYDLALKNRRGRTTRA